MGRSRIDPNGMPTYRRRCADCVFVVEGERIALVLQGVRDHSFKTGHNNWNREDRPRDPMEGVVTETFSAVGIINNRAEPRDKDKPYLRVVDNNG